MASDCTRKANDRLKIRHIHTLISDVCQVDGFGFLIDQFLKLFGLVAFSKLHFNAKSLEGYFKLVVSAAIEK